MSERLSLRGLLSRAMFVGLLLLDLLDAGLDLQLVRELSERGEHGYAALMCLATLISLAAGVVLGRHAHAVQKVDAADRQGSLPGVDAMILASGALLSFSVEDSSTLFILANVEGLYEGAGKSGWAADLNLLTTALSSLAVLALLLWSTGTFILAFARTGYSGTAAIIAGPVLLLSGLVAYFTAVATALYTRADASPRAQPVLDEAALVTT